MYRYLSIAAVVLSAAFSNSWLRNNHLNYQELS